MKKKKNGSRRKVYTAAQILNKAKGCLGSVHVRNKEKLTPRILPFGKPTKGRWTVIFGKAGDKVLEMLFASNGEILSVTGGNSRDEDGEAWGRASLLCS